jgi:hypothetical protein
VLCVLELTATCQMKSPCSSLGEILRRLFFFFFYVCSFHDTNRILSLRRACLPQQQRRLVSSRPAGQVAICILVRFWVSWTRGKLFRQWCLIQISRIRKLPTFYMTNCTKYESRQTVLRIERQLHISKSSIHHLAHVLQQRLQQH